MRAGLVVFLLFVVARAQARIEVAFIEIRKPDGQILQLEPGGRFAHVAISYNDQWLHAHPYRGSELISTAELQKIGKIKEVLVISQDRSLNSAQVSRFLGREYDRMFSWKGPKTYCSKLIANLLNLRPQPMHFDPKVWPPEYWVLEGKPGMSPDGLYKELLKRGYLPEKPSNV